MVVEIKWGRLAEVDWLHRLLEFAFSPAVEFDCASEIAEPRR